MTAATVTTWSDMMTRAIEGESVDLADWLQAAELAASIDGQLGAWLALASGCQRMLEQLHARGLPVGPMTRAALWELGASADFAAGLLVVKLVRRAGE